MNSREFNKEINGLFQKIKGKTKFLNDKANALSNDKRDALMKYIVRNRAPVIAALLPDNIDHSWLAAMGYMYQSTSAKTGLVMVHTCEHQIT